MPVLPCLLRVSLVVVTHAIYSLFNACQRLLHLLHALLPRFHPGIQTTIANYLLQLILVSVQTEKSGQYTA